MSLTTLPRPLLLLTMFATLVACADTMQPPHETTPSSPPSSKQDCPTCQESDEPSSMLLAPRAQLDYCERSTIDTLTLPVLPNQDATHASFLYHYQYTPPADPSLPVIVYLPGGPGSRGIQKTRDQFQAVPQGYGLLQTESRGSACNDFVLPEELDAEEVFTPEMIARDVLATLDYLGIENYILYGHSFGTISATTIAHLSPTFSHQPMAVVLEGTVGKAFSADEYVSGYTQPFSFLKQFLSPEATAAISVEEPDALGLTPHQWGQAIQTLLVVNPQYLVALLNAAFSDDETVLAQSISHLRLMAGEEPELQPEEATSGVYGSNLFKTLACSYIWDLNVDFRLRAGELEQELVLCAGGELTSRAYDSASLPIKDIPIFYLQGKLDPATTLDSALYHMTHQQETTRHMFQFDWAGHNILSGVFYGFADHCKQELWKSISGEISPEDAALACDRESDTVHLITKTK